MMIATVTAVVTGPLLGLLTVLSLGLNSLSLDIAVVLALGARAAAAVLVATVATLPALRRAVSPESLRAE